MAKVTPLTQPTKRHIEDLRNLVARVAKELCPECLRPSLEIVNRSSNHKFSMVVRANGNHVIVAETVARSFKIPGCYDKVEDAISVHGSLWVDDIEKLVRKVLIERFKKAETFFILNKPLQFTPGVTAFEDNEGTVRLEFERLTPEAYKRIVAALVPLLNVPRYDRDEVV